MNDQVFNRLQAQLIKHEGLKLKPYYCTSKKLSIGIGRNLDDNGISRDEALMMLRNDIAEANKQLTYVFGAEWLQYSPNRQVALLDMMFNLGAFKFRLFKKMIAAVKARDWDRAALEALDSKWAKEDVGARAIHIAKQLENG